MLVVLGREDELSWLSLRNVAEVHLLAADQLNTYDVLVTDDVVFTKEALEEFGEFASRAGQRSEGSAEGGRGNEHGRRPA